jgi:hypothetical protein
MSAGAKVDLIWATIKTAAEIHASKTEVRAARLKAYVMIVIQKPTVIYSGVHILLELIAAVKLVHVLSHGARVV